MTLTQLEYILAVSKHQNFHKAARSCFVTQPTLSAQIKKLEEELEAPIFDRSKSPVTETILGAKIIAQAKLTISTAAKIPEIILEQKGEVTGELRVGIIPTIAPYLLPLFLKSLNKNYPKLDLTISELTTENSLKALNNEDIDLAILATKEDNKKYFQKKLYEEEMLLFSHPDHPFLHKKKLKADELSHEEIWLLEDGHCLRDEVLKVCRLKADALSNVNKENQNNLRLKIGSLEALRYLISENFGYTLLPYLATIRLSAKEKKLLRNFSSPQPKRTIQLTSRRLVLRKSAIDALEKEILSGVSKQLK